MGDFQTPRWQRLRLQILERDGYLCQIRGPKCTGEATQVDHIMPVDAGGDMWDPTNLRAACRWCNNWRAVKQKQQGGWQRSNTHIVLVVGPPGAGKSTYIEQNAGPLDAIVDYDGIFKAVWPGMGKGASGGQHEIANELRNRILRRIRRGELDAPRVWIKSANPQAEQVFPHHEVVLIDPGREEVLRRNDSEIIQHVIEQWYDVREGTLAEPSMREW